MVIGASGQDGTLLGRLLKSKGYQVAGVSRGPADECYDESIVLDVMDKAALSQVVRTRHPAEIYYLASYHRSSQAQGAALAEGEASRTFDVNLNSYIAVLEAALDLTPRPRIFYASSSLIFGNAEGGLATEQTPPQPQCLYSISKLTAMKVSEQFRQVPGMHISIGILFNHESAFRNGSFLSKRIVDSIKAIKQGRSQSLVVGELDAACDWGYAGDFVEAMWRMLQKESGDTYVVATGTLHTVRDWVDAGCALAGLSIGNVVREDPSLLFRRRPVLRGDSSKLQAITDWRPATEFGTMVEKIYHEEA